METKTLYSARDLKEMGFSKGIVYELLHREDLPTIRIGKRVFMHKQLFDEWLKSKPNITRE